MALPDLIVQSITHTPRYPTTNYTVTFTVTVKNQGDMTADASVLYVAITGPQNKDYTFNAPALDLGATYSAQFIYKLTPKGTYTVTAFADNTNVVVESDETNNAKTIDVLCTTPNKRDLVVEILEYTPANPIASDAITITAGVKNIGPTQAEASTLRIDVAGETNPPTYSIPALASDAIYTVQRQITLAPGTYPITATADIYDTVSEFDENNNTTIEYVTVAPLPIPDLIVSSLTHTPANPTTTDTVTITAVVQNTGITSSTASILEIDVSGESTPTTYEIPPLVPRETYQIERQMNFIAPGSYRVIATADANDDVAESYETNNTTTDTINVIEPPDLIVSKLGYSPDIATTSETITITAEVKNASSTACTSSTLAILIGNEGDTVLFAIPALDGGTTHSVELEIVFSETGSILVTATADAEDDVAEWNEENNVETIFIDVYAWDFDTLKNYLLGKSDFSDFEKRLYDINKDGKVDMGDLVSLILHLRNIV
jgi:subtilase family serine protease